MRYWRRVATIYLALSLPKESSGQPGLGPDTKLPLLGLAPGGVYLVRRCFHLRGELLPHLFTLTIYQRLFSVALSVGSPRPVVNGHPTEWSSDFPLNLLMTSPAIVRFPQSRRKF